MKFASATILILILSACASHKYAATQYHAPSGQSAEELGLGGNQSVSLRKPAQTSESRDYRAYIDPNQFGACVAMNINLKGGELNFRRRVKEAQFSRSYMTEHSAMITQVEQSLGFFEKRIWEESSFASIPFIDFDLPSSVELLKQFPIQSALFETYQQKTGLDPVDRSDLIAIVETAANASKSFDANKNRPTGDSYIENMQKAESLANPLVFWLVRQPKGSVSHWALLKYAISVYDGDAITALAVIGEMFWQEVLSADPHRKANAVLASKMVPLISPTTSNPVGDNYHFWRIVTAAYYQGGTFLGRIYSRVDSKEPGHLAANAFGLDVADATLRSIDNRRVQCALE